ncbi:MAG: AlpA family phage regulatory protein [Chromatiaceae bacterium]
MLLRLTDVKALTGMGKTLIYRLVAQKRFPQPVHPGGTRISAWLASEIDEWLREQIINHRGVRQ